MSNPLEEEGAIPSWTPFSTNQLNNGNLPHNDVYGMPQAHPNVCYQSPLSESYSVLPVGHGNFLKVYHSVENEPPTNFNKYELFSSNTILPTMQSVRSDDLLSFDGGAQPAAFGNSSNTSNTILSKWVNNCPSTLSASFSYSPFGEESTRGVNFHQLDQGLLDRDTIGSNPPTSIPGPSPSPSSHTIKMSKTNGSFENHAPNPIPEVKKRIVAEVKPMRMSYSDVLSKFNNEDAVGINAINNGFEATTQNGRSAKSSEKIKGNNAFLADRKGPMGASDEKEKFEYRTKKQEGTAFSKSDEYQNVSSSMIFTNGSATNNKDKKKPSPKHEIRENVQNSNLKINAKKPVNGSSAKINKTKNSANIGNETATKKRSAAKRLSDESVKTGSKNGFNGNSTNEKEFYYNVTKTEVVYERSKKSTIQSKRSSRQNYSGISSSSKSSTSRFDKQQSYSKRGQSSKNQRNRTYDLVAKLLEKWLEYTLKILTWLYYLVSDIVVLGCTIAYEKIYHFYSNSHVYMYNMKRIYKVYSEKSMAWLKNLYKKFDSKFKKDSKWAFWRTFYKKKREEPPPDFYKTGRLPQTGDEAMYSLLNCKGKDAYSILGVPKNSSQEQIRKHYKKIAVLVHPDKNKQPGAEEAFKVLQRAFELIGEPESRSSYDQSLVEALNAEKAWTELHDLLSQLQTKIAEAANTIRCSSCGLRHPRKITDRALYAARECSSCKIRHSAREGDIWAETTCFGLRWNYLALMEGKVYDITEWANCQKGALSHLQPNSHVVQYRIVRGGQQQQQQNSQQDKDKSKRESPSEPSLDEFLDNLYSRQNPHNQGNFSRRRARRN